MKQAQYTADVERKLGCSSQEEHVLKHIVIFMALARNVLLLARGACIETVMTAGETTGVFVAPRKRSMY